MADKRQDWKQLKLVVRKGTKSGKEYKLDKPNIGIGRSHLNQIVLDDPGISQFHARIITEGKKCIITDLGAHEGLRINSKKIETQLLTPGDKIQIGQAYLETVRDIGWGKETTEKKAPSTRKKEPGRKWKFRLRIPVRLSLLVVLLTALLAAIAILDLHWLNQLLNWK